MPDFKHATQETVWFLTGQIGAMTPIQRVAVKSSPFQIGRRVDLDLSLAFPGVSKVHAQLEPSVSQCLVRDLGSTNGTYLNGAKICGEAELKPRDVLQFANAVFQVGCEHARDNTMTLSEDVTDQALAFVQFDRLMSERAVLPFFQPIVSLETDAIIGFEVLARSRVLGLQSAAQLFETASLLKQETQLSQLMRTLGMLAGRTLTGRPEIFLNTHPAEIGQPDFIPSIRELRQAHPDQAITLEIHETSITEPKAMRELQRTLKEMGMKLAYDDFGAGQARLVELIEVPPDFLKFDMKLIRGIHTAPAPGGKRSAHWCAW